MCELREREREQGEKTEQMSRGRERKRSGGREEGDR